MGSFGLQYFSIHTKKDLIMKKILMLVFMIGLFAVGWSCATQAKAQAQAQEIVKADLVADQAVMTIADEAQVPEVPVNDSPINWLELLKNNPTELILGLLAFVKVIVNWTPTEKDNKVFELFDKIIGWIIPNRKKGGGTF